MRTLQPYLWIGRLDRIESSRRELNQFGSCWLVFEQNITNNYGIVRRGVISIHELFAHKSGFYLQIAAGNRLVDYLTVLTKIVDFLTVLEQNHDSQLRCNL